VVTSLVQDRAGTIWCGTFGGLYSFEQRGGKPEFRHVPTQSGVTSLLEDRRGNLWLGLVRGILRLRPDGRIESYSDRQGWPNDTIHSLLEDRDGRVWVGTRQHLWRLTIDPDPARPVVARGYSIEKGLPADEIKGLFQASDGGLWAGSHQGLIRVVPTQDGNDFRVRTYTAAQGLSSRPVHSVAEDRGGNLWVGTAGGAARLARSGITAFTEADGLNGTSAIFNDRAGNLFVVAGPSSEHFISRFDGERFTAIRPTLRPGPRFERLWRENQGVLHDSAGEWWVATGHGLYRFPKAVSLEQVTRKAPKATYTTREGLASSNIWGLFEDSRGDIWIGAVGGLSRWQRLSERFHHYQERDGWRWRYSPVSFGEDRSGAIWIGMSIGGGLVRFRDGRFARFTTADGLAEGGILNLFFDSSGRLWVPMSPGGVFRIDNPQAERPAIVPYTTDQGLAGNDVEAVTEDRRGRLYLASARGIDRLDPATGHVRHYTATDGALNAGVNSAVQARDGALWFRYESGLVRLVPEPDAAAPPPPILITGLRIAGEARPVSALGETELPSMALPANRNQLQIDFVALGFTPGEGSRYQYKLEGTADSWTTAGEQRTVNFAHLAPGRYRFLVRAISGDGVVSTGPARFAFTISPPIWRRWWFETLVVAAMLLVIYGVHRYRVVRLLELERVRTRIAADLHDDIGSSLSQISVLSEVLRTQLGTPDAPVSGNLSLINRVAQEALDSMSDIVWAINPSQDHLGDVVRRMRRLASEVLPARDIAFTFTAPADEYGLTLGADIRRQLFLMFKETMNNIVRHSRCARADIALTLDGPWLVLVMADDGEGFDPDRVSDGNGLVSLRRRARALGGELGVSSGQGEGTVVTIWVPHGHHWRHGAGHPQTEYQRSGLRG
jgi:ligand-binding sensor domain-containing protein/two-component sensor histidine kinase